MKREPGSDRGRGAPPPENQPRTDGFWLAAAAFVVLVVATQLVDAHPAPVMRGLSIVLCGAAVVFGGLPFFQLRAHGLVPPGKSFFATTAVAHRGLYSLVRHPQYLGYDFLAWGLTASAPHWATVLPALVLTVGFAIQARAEERHLLDRFGDEYQDYMRTVPRFGLVTGLVRRIRRVGG